MDNNIIYPTKSSDIPNVIHYAIIEFDTIYIPGDERSQNNPGHGYPAHSETSSKYIAYLKKEDWEAEIFRRTKSAYQRSFKAIMVTPYKISLMVELSKP